MPGINNSTKIVAAVGVLALTGVAATLITDVVMNNNAEQSTDINEINNFNVPFAISALALLSSAVSVIAIERKTVQNLFGKCHGGIFSNNAKNDLGAPLIDGVTLAGEEINITPHTQDGNAEEGYADIGWATIDEKVQLALQAEDDKWYLVNDAEYIIDPDQKATKLAEWAAADGSLAEKREQVKEKTTVATANPIMGNNGV